MNDFVTNVMSARLGETHLFYVGQAGYIIKNKYGKLLGIDLYLSECVERIEGNIGFKRMLPKLFGAFDIEFDYLITTHAHVDHFDIDSIPLLMSHPNTKLFASTRCREEVLRLQMKESNVHYVKAGQSVSLDGFDLHFVSCDHSDAAPDAFGVVISVDGKIIYMAGDTCLHLEKAEEYMAFGEIDMLIAPINGAFGNLNEQDCADLSNALQPKITIPSHYGMFPCHGGNPGKFYHIMKEQYPNNNFMFMTVGERITI